MSYLTCLCLALWVLFTLGCKSVSPRSAFLKAVGEERTNYVRVYEVSLESLRDVENQSLKATKIATRGVRDATNECANVCPAIEQRMLRIEELAHVWHEDRTNFISLLAPIYDSRRDVILFCDYRSATNQQLSWVVMRGSIIRGKVFVEDGKRVSYFQE